MLYGRKVITSDIDRHLHHPIPKTSWRNHWYVRNSTWWMRQHHRI